jgi:cysteine synthase A
VRCVAIEPDGVRTYSGGDKSGKHRLEGIGNSFITAICRTDLIDDVVQVTDADAYTYARRLAREEGIFGGTTSGANVWAAVQRARKLGPGKKIVTLIVDSGLKYLKGDLYR